ncbi:hypothetical protein [Oxalobacter paraformigenes]|uniref:Uncharacterized protein n=1 Tax=Oxalobacter paraformigenes TaxID=556268 RepID=C3X4R4_9BURK|nr:hypothetical protein [Oxalobacter paraformigenes]EEO28200.2 hypothetical protein OFAG_01353 [Oxalobacter paraformigenes]
MKEVTNATALKTVVEKLNNTSDGFFSCLLIASMMNEKDSYQEINREVEKYCKANGIGNIEEKLSQVLQCAFLWAGHFWQIKTEQFTLLTETMKRFTGGDMNALFQMQESDRKLKARLQAADELLNEMFSPFGNVVEPVLKIAMSGHFVNEDNVLADGKAKQDMKSVYRAILQELN